MKYSVSSLSYVGPRMKWMNKLPEDFGIEIFWDYGDEEYYNGILAELMSERSGAFSIHGPMGVSFADECADDKLYAHLVRPFGLYHRFDSKFYVLHTHTNLALSSNPTEDEIRRKRDVSIARINRFDEICRSEGVQLVIENIGKRADGETMFDEAAFLALFRQNEDLHCLLDLGHATIGDYDISNVQRALNSRLIAYHVHDNHGKTDDHIRMGKGVIDWNAWKEGCRTYTPEAEIVFEYDCVPDEAAYIEDKAAIEA